MINLLKGIKVARVSTIPFFVLTQLRSQLEAISDAGAKVTVIASDDEVSDSINQLKYCEFKPIYIAREINIKADIATLFQLVKLFKKENFDIVHSTTPKAGLLCALAAKLSKVPVRLHTFTGQPWVTMSGIKRNIVKFCDKLIGFLNTHTYVDSFSQLEFLIETKVVNQEKTTVLGSGSLAGVNLSRFNSDNFSAEDREKIRKQYKISETTLVLLFVGRITRDKGIFELIEAVSRLESNQDFVLLVVGPFEQDLEQEIRAFAQRLCGEKVIFTGFCSEPEKFMAITDILCLPSYREGFGTVIIEAAAMGIPVVGTRIYGLTDAVIDGETGCLVEPKNVQELTQAIQKLISDLDLRLTMGQKAKTRALNEFDSKKCGALLVSEYRKLLDTHKSN